MQQKQILYKSRKLSYLSIGHGPVVVLLHGFGEDSSIWENQLPAFEGHRLIVPDLPGSGQSEEIEDMSMEGLAEAVKEIIVHETAALYFKEGEPDSVILIGHSMGGYVTLAFVEKYSRMLRAFGLFHSTAYADSEEKIQTRRKGIEFMEKYGAAAFLKTSIPNLYSPLTQENNYPFIEKQLATAHNFSTTSLVSYYKSMIQRQDRTAILKQTHLPVLFILGKYDTAVPLKDGLELTHIPNLSYIHILANSGHMGMIEEREEANRILLDYVHTIQNITQPE